MLFTSVNLHGDIFLKKISGGVGNQGSVTLSLERESEGRVKHCYLENSGELFVISSDHD